jgi:hypothetical protein
MARTVKGRRIAFDNISVGNAAGLERTIVGTSLGSGSQTTLVGNGERLRTATTGAPSTPGSGEFYFRTVSGGQVTDLTTDLGH